MEKSVNKLVEKMVEKMWMLNVKKSKMWNNQLSKFDVFTQRPIFKQSFAKYLDSFYTKKMTVSNLLKMSFTTFTHRTINTTTVFINKENEINF